MCGIIGAFGDDLPVDLSQRLERGMELMKHRGPDDQGREIDSMDEATIALGHVRLSIIDLSSSGRQPMTTSDGRYVMVYNGEIYNYRELRSELEGKGVEFRSNTDSEVLLAAWSAWGEACLARLTGMFAFAIFDRVEQSLTCARDAFGIKPFFYSLSEGNFFFASEIPAIQELLKGTGRLNLQRAYDYLVYDSYDDKASTFREEVSQLMPGHLLKVGLGKQKASIEIQQWWIPAIRERTDLTFDDAVDELRERFLESIRLHLRSDVPFGANLSGGLDSSAIVCGIRKLEPDIPLHTFTFVARNSPLNEERWADKVNKHANAIGHKVTIEGDEFYEDLEKIVRVQGEPFGSTSIYAQYRVYQFAKEQGITVTLDGQGADEMLAGYFGYPQARLHSLLEKREWLSILTFLKNWPKWPGRPAFKGYLYLAELLLPRSSWFESSRLRGKTPNPSWLHANALKEQGVSLGEPQTLVGRGDATGRRLVESLRHALTNNKLIHLLRILDRNSMSWSMESRVPFLTVDLVEFLLALPEEFLLSKEGQTKRIFREAMRGIVPDEVIERKDKVGFVTPEKDWLVHSRKKVLDWLECLDQAGFVKKDKCVREVSAVLDGTKPFSWQAWRMVNFAQWFSMQSYSSS
jgi:asparagine synthase (glutamine-hydrolysing)